MIQKIRNVFVVLASLTVVAIPALVPATAAAANNFSGISKSTCSGTNGDISGGSNTDCDATASNSKINSLLAKIVNIFSIVVGVIAVIMIIVGGLRYITSGGESSNISGAKNTIIFALVGLIIVALAQLIVHFVLGNAIAASS